MQPDPRKDERLGLSRRSFFFFGAILAAKPEIVVPPLTPWPSAGGPWDDDFRHSILSLTLPYPCLLRAGERIYVWDAITDRSTMAQVMRVNGSALVVSTNMTFGMAE